MDISYFESGYIVESYFTRIANAEVNLTANFSGYTQADLIASGDERASADLQATITLQATATKVYRITADPIAVSQTNTGGASAFDGISSGLGLTTYDYFGALKIDAGPLVEA